MVATADLLLGRAPSTSSPAESGGCRAGPRTPNPQTWARSGPTGQAAFPTAGRGLGVASAILTLCWKKLLETRPLPRATDGREEALAAALQAAPPDGVGLSFYRGQPPRGTSAAPDCGARKGLPRACPGACPSRQPRGTHGGGPGAGLRQGRRHGHRRGHEGRTATGKERAQGRRGAAMGAAARPPPSSLRGRRALAQVSARGAHQEAEAGCAAN